MEDEYLYHHIVAVGVPAAYSLSFSVVLRRVNIHCVVVGKQLLRCREADLAAPATDTVSLKKRINFNSFSAFGAFLISMKLMDMLK